MGRLLLVAGIVLLAIWFLGLVSSFTLGGGIHVLLVLAIILIFCWIILGRRGWASQG